MLPWFIAIQPFYIINAHNWFTLLFGAWTKILFKCRFIIFLVTKWIVFHIKTKQFFIKYYSLQKKEYFATINAIPTNLIIFRYNYIQFFSSYCYQIVGCQINVDDCFDLSHCQYGNYCKENISSTYVLVVNGSRLCLKLTRVDTIF